MTVTVSVITSSRTNVIVVPNGAITTQGNQSYVQVISASGALEKRAVQTGLSDLQNTEITSGLTEGEKISIPLGTTSYFFQDIDNDIDTAGRRARRRDISRGR